MTPPNGLVVDLIGFISPLYHIMAVSKMDFVSLGKDILVPGGVPRITISIPGSGR
jgi:hypothetical protein